MLRGSKLVERGRGGMSVYLPVSFAHPFGTVLQARLTGHAAFIKLRLAPE